MPSRGRSEPSGLLAILGPTATGKSQVALHLAQQLGGEIISVDSMQVYRGMDIGTAKPSRQDRTLVPHHLIDIVDLRESFNAARFVGLARSALESIRGRGRLPILCGGTGLYLKSLLEGLGASPPGDSELRSQLEQMSLPELLAELLQRDPLTYHQIDRQNPRRVIRALEVCRITGQPYSRLRAAWSNASRAPEQGLIFCLAREASDLRNRIDVRVDRMFQDGLVAETRALLQGGLAGNRTAQQALGYRQVIEYLQDARSLQETVELIKIRTRQFAKRQMTWFRRQLPVQWLQIAAGQAPEQIAAAICERGNALVSAQAGPQPAELGCPGAPDSAD